MAQKTIQGNEALARRIKLRRNELGLTIEEAASRAGVGTKTWSRYEAGESIRKDKCKGICKALNWRGLQNGEEDESISIQEYKNHKAWSRFLENEFGAGAAISFAVGSDILLDKIEEDMTALASMPAGSHIGQLDVSWLHTSLPSQFLMHYDYNFLYRTKCALREMRMRARSGLPMTAHSVIEELLLYLCYEEASTLIDLSDEIIQSKNNGDANDCEAWVFDLFGDMDIVTFLYSNRYVSSDHPYYFSYWWDDIFYTE